MYRGFVLPQHRTALRKLLSSEPLIRELFSERWIANNLMPAPDQRITELNPLYAYLIAPKEQYLTIKGLQYSATDGRLRIIRQLMREKQPENIRALVRNLQTFAILRSAIPQTALEPSVPKGSKQPDLVTMCNGQICYIEVFTVSASASEYEGGRVLDELHARINLLGDNPFVIHVDIVRLPCWRELEWLWTCIKRTIYGYRGKSNIPEVIINDRAGNAILKLRLTDPNKRDKGFWGTVGTGAGFRSDDLRLKGKILDKVGALQFSSRDTVNGYIVYLDDFFMDDRDARNAVLGQDMVVFREGSDKAEYGRRNNGVLHHEVGRQPLLEWIDFFIFAKHPSDLQKPDDLLIIRNDERRKVTEDVIRDMFRSVA